MWLCLCQSFAPTLTSRQRTWSAGSNSESPSSNRVSRRKDDRPAHSHPNADTRKSSRFAVSRLPTQGRVAGSQSASCRRKKDRRASPLRPDFRRLSSGLELWVFLGPKTPHRLPARPPARLPACQPAAVNNFYKNLLGCLSVLPAPISYNAFYHKYWLHFSQSTNIRRAETVYLNKKLQSFLTCYEPLHLRMKKNISQLCKLQMQM
jgi:hypothetical protein